MQILELAMFNANFLGSFGDSLLTLGRELKKNNDQMIVCFPEERNWMRIFRGEDIPVEIVPMSYPVNVKGIIKLFNLVNKYRAEVIHTNFGIESRIAGAIIRLISPLHPKVVWHWRGGPSRPNVFKKVIGSAIYKILDVALVNVHIPNSDLIKEQLLSYGIVTPEKVKVIYNGINASRFNPLKVKNARAELKIESHEFVIGNVRNFRSRVNHKIIIDTARIVLSKKDNIKFLLVGDGPTRKDIENYASSLGLKNKIIFTGIQENVERIYASCDLTVVSYEPWCGETVCNAVYESLCMEKPVVLPDIGSISHILNEGEGVFMVRPEPEEMARKILELINTPEAIIKAGKMGRGAVLKRFTTSLWAQEMRSVFLEVLKTL